jgi:DNA-binding GntR family transcriptional regulator
MRTSDNANRTSNDTRSTLVADVLRQAIWDGVYPCGDRLTELTIAQELSVSQNTVREALRILEQEGWLVHKARRGVYVRSFTADEAEELYELWALLEPQAFAWAVEKLTRVELLAAIRPMVSEARELMNAGRWLVAWDALLRFHKTIAELSGRSQTILLLNQLYNQARLLEVDFEYHQPRPVETRQQRVDAYDQVLGMVKFADSEKARQALADRIREEGKPIVRWLAMTT